MLDKETLKNYREHCEMFVKNKWACGLTPCSDCPFHFYNNGHKLNCDDLIGKTTSESLKYAQMFLDGKIGFQDGKLVEFID